MIVKAILSAKGGDVISIDPTATLDTAVKTLAEHKIGALLVLGPDRRVIGILSERDIVRALAERGAGVLSEPLAQVMTRKVVTCSESDSVGVLMERMTTGKFRHLPVIEDERVIGVVSIGDVVKHRLQEIEQEIRRAARLHPDGLKTAIADDRTTDDRRSEAAVRLLFGGRPACRGRAGDREHLVDDGVVGITATRERLHRRGVETAVLDEAVVDVDADHLSEHDETVGRFSVQILEIDDLQELAFERAGRGGDARRPDQPRGGGSEPRLLHLVHAARKLRRGLHHRGAQVDRSRDCRRTPWSVRRRPASPWALRWRTARSAEHRRRR